MPDPTFTIAMPAYNAAGTIAASIRSVLGQTRDDHELIVVDDGSNDDTKEIVASFGGDERIQLLTQENRGPGAARNTAIVAGRGRYVSMLDSDDLWLPTYLETMGAALDAAPEAGLAYTDAWVLDDHTGRIRKTTAMAYQHPPIPPPSEPMDFLRALLEHRNFVFTSTTVRRSIFHDVGLFDTAPRPSEDYEMWLRIAAGGFRAVRPPGTLAVYRKRSGSLSSDALSLLAGEQEAVRLVAVEYDVPDEIREIAERQLRKLDRLAAGLGDGGGMTAVRARARRRAVEVKDALVRPLMWHHRPPPEVAALLAAVEADGDDAGSSAQARLAHEGSQRDAAGRGP